MPWWAWALLGLLALVGEAASMALFLLNVAIAAFVAAAIAYGGAPVPPQVVAFVLISVLLIGLARPRMMRVLVGRTPRAALTVPAGLVDRIATVTETVSGEGGMIRVGKAEFWSARPSDTREIPAGSRVRVTRVEGLTAYVEPLPPLGTVPPALSGLVVGDAQAAPVEQAAGPAWTVGDAQAALSEQAAPPPAPRPSDETAAPTFGALLRAHRIACGLTQEELAERARLSTRAISDLERGLHRTPQRETVHLLADALGLAALDRAAFEGAARRMAALSAQPPGPHPRTPASPGPA